MIEFGNTRSMNMFFSRIISSPLSDRKFASLLPAQHVQRFDELADAVDLGAEQAKLDDLFGAEVLGEIGIDLVFVDGVLPRLNRSA